MHLTPIASASRSAAVTLPDDLQVGTATLAIEQRDWGTGARTGYAPPAEYTPIWGDRRADGALTGWQLAGATSLDQALTAARSLVQASATVDTLPEDHGPARVERRVTPLALLQAADGAWYATDLHAAPTAGSFVQHQTTTSWSEDAPKRQHHADLGGLRYLNPLPALRAIVSDDVYWPATATPAAPVRF